MELCSKKNFDVTDEKTVESFIEGLVHDLGGIDILSNVGTAIQSPLLEIEMVTCEEALKLTFHTSHWQSL